MNLLLAIACASGTNDKDSSTSEDPSRPVLIESDLVSQWDRVNAMIQNTLPGQEITEDASTGYVSSTVGTTYNGLIAGVSSYTIDGNAIYSGSLNYNQPTWIASGEKDDTYNPADLQDESGSVTILATEEFSVGNSEGEKSPDATPTEQFPSGFYWGNNYRFIAEITTDAPGVPASPVQQVSDFAKTESEDVPADVATWFGAVGDSQTQTPLSDADLGWPDQNISDASDTFQYPPHQHNTNISGVYRVSAGPFVSDSELGEGVYQQEYGLLAQDIKLQNYTVGVLPASGSPDLAILSYESDSGYGSSGYTQMPTAVTAIMDDLEASDEEPRFTMIVAHDLDNEKSVIAAYCKPDGTPIYDYDGLSTSPVPTVANAADWAAAGYVLKDASQVYCGKDLLTGNDGAPMASLWTGAYEFRRNP